MDVTGIVVQITEVLIPIAAIATGVLTLFALKFTFKVVRNTVDDAEFLEEPDGLEGDQELYWDFSDPDEDGQNGPGVFFSCPECGVNSIDDRDLFYDLGTDGICPQCTAYLDVEDF